MKQFDSVLLQAHWFEEGDFWAVSANGYLEGSDEPESIETDPTSFSSDYGRDYVVEQLKMISELWLAQGMSNNITILIDGNEIMSDETYFLQNCTAGFVGNSPLFWAKTGGYTPWIAEAKEWSKDEAELMITGTKGTHTWKIWLTDDVRRLAKRTVDMQDLHRLAERKQAERKQADKQQDSLLEAGYYWCYAYDNDGNTLEIKGEPSVVWYEDGELHLVDSDTSVTYDQERYKLLSQLKY